MITKRIFEMPIYSISQEKFYKKWNIRNEKECSEWTNAGWPYNEAKSEIARLAFPKTIWKYAQIIGYLVVDITKSDICFRERAQLQMLIYMRRWIIKESDMTILQKYSLKRGLSMGRIFH